MSLKLFYPCHVLLLLLTGVFLLNSCSPVDKSKAASDVDFNDSQNIQVSFNGNIYNVNVSYNGKECKFVYGDGCGAVSGAAVLINDGQYTVSFKEMVFSGETASLPRNFLPHIVYSFFKSNGSVITLNQYDENENCLYFNSKVLNNTVKLEAYDNNDGTSALCFEVK